MGSVERLQRHFVTLTPHRVEFNHGQYLRALFYLPLLIRAMVIVLLSFDIFIIRVIG